MFVTKNRQKLHCYNQDLLMSARFFSFAKFSLTENWGLHVTKLKKALYFQRTLQISHVRKYRKITDFDYGKLAILCSQ